MNGFDGGGTPHTVSWFTFWDLIDHAQPKHVHTCSYIFKGNTFEAHNVVNTDSWCAVLPPKALIHHHRYPELGGTQMGRNCWVASCKTCTTLERFLYVIVIFLLHAHIASFPPIFLKVSSSFPFKAPTPRKACPKLSTSLFLRKLYVAWSVLGRYVPPLNDTRYDQLLGHCSCTRCMHDLFVRKSAPFQVGIVHHWICRSAWVDWPIPLTNRWSLLRGRLKARQRPCDALGPMDLLLSCCSQQEPAWPSCCPSRSRGSHTLSLTQGHTTTHQLCWFYDTKWNFNRFLFSLDFDSLSRQSTKQTLVRIEICHCDHGASLPSSHSRLLRKLRHTHTHTLTLMV